MGIAICILAKDEAPRIAATLAQLGDQSLLRSYTDDINIHVVANGCADDTAEIARSSAELFKGSSAKLHVHDIPEGGKSRAWNKTVHELVDPSAELLIFIDADITFVDERVLDRLVSGLKACPDAAVYSGYPVKDISTKSFKSPLDLFSLEVSENSRCDGAINGSLYIARVTALREVWLPDQTPGEDGFLSAMIKTRGFTMPPDPDFVVSAAQPTHYYQAHRPFGFYTHERRMIVGTMVNIWIFEFFWSLNLKSPAGRLICEWNRSDPRWVERLVRQHSEKRRWLIRSPIVWRRFRENAGRPWWKRAGYLPIALAATILTFPAAAIANRRLKELGAASTW